MPGLRRAGGVESGQAEAGVPVLRHRVAVPDRSRDRQGRRARSRRRRCASCPRRSAAGRTERRSVQCQSCRAVMVFDPARVGQNCEFCGSPALVDYQEIKAPIRPQGVLPFRIDASRVRDDIRRWWRSKWLAPGKLARAALVDTVQQPLHPVLDVRRAACTARGTPRPATTTTSTCRAATARADRSCGRSGACAGSRPPASSTRSSTTSRCRARRGCRSICCGRSSRFRRRSSCRTTRRSCPATSSSTTRSC